MPILAIEVEIPERAAGEFRPGEHPLRMWFRLVQDWPVRVAQAAG